MKRSTFLLLVVLLPVICLGQNIVVQNPNFEAVIDCWKRNSLEVYQWEENFSASDIPFMVSKYGFRPAKSTLIMLDYRWIKPGYIHGHGGWTVYLNLLKMPSRGQDMHISMPSKDIVPIVAGMDPYSAPLEQLIGNAVIHRPLVGHWKIKMDFNIVDEPDTLKMPIVSFKARRMPNKILEDLKSD